MRNNAIMFALAKAGHLRAISAVQYNKDVHKSKGWNANLSYKIAQQLKAQGIID